MSGLSGVVCAVCVWHVWCDMVLVVWVVSAVVWCVVGGR